MTIELSDEEFKILLLAMGYATGAAAKEGNHQLANSFLILANAVNRDNPRWIPYKTEEPSR
jgi:hypothetical protein